MPGDQWHHQLEVFQQDVETLRSAIPHPTRWSAALKEAVDALETALEALRVADEERQQHQAAVTGAQPAAAALRDSETHSAAILQTAVDGIITIDEGGSIASFNPAAERLFGYTAGEVIGQNVRMLMPLPYREEHDGYLVRYLQTGERRIIGIGREVRARRRDGTTFPIALAVSEMHLDGRRMFTGIIHDLTVRVRMEEALRQQALLLELSYEPILIWDEQRGIVLWNQGCEQLYGFTKAEATGRVSYALLHTVFPVSFAVFTTTLWRDKHWSGELRQTTRDGREVRVESRWQVIAMAGREVVLEVLRDITVRKQAEAALRASEARFRTMADAAPVLLWMSGLDMGCTYFNHGWLAFTGRTLDQERGDGWAAGVHPEDSARCVATYQTAFAARQPFEMEYRLRRADGAYRWVFDRGVLLGEPGERFGGYIGCAIDITARKAAEAVLRHAQEELERRVQERTAALAVANEEVRRFASLVSHDLRAPLINLRGFANELRDASTVLTDALPTIVPHLEGRQRAAVTRVLGGEIPEALGFIETAVTRMDRLIEAVLQLSRLGQRALHLEPVDTARLVQDTLRTLAYQLTARQVQVTVGPLPVVQADALALSQIFGNLLTNAVAYLAPSRPGALAITAPQCPERTVFAVQDNGRGITAADILHVFEPFRRVGRQDTVGEGMGLAYVQMLVRRHGGDITCASTLGGGTTFTFTMAPARPERSP
jgi:PAS domain S-box-containing protein